MQTVIWNAIAKSQYPVITDETSDFSGPLAGMLALLKQAQTPWVVFVPCDVPYFPSNFWLKRSIVTKGMP